MEMTLQNLQNADNICRQANAHFEKAAQIEQEIVTLTAGLKKCKTKWILIGFGIWYACGLVGSILGRIPYVGTVLMALCSLSAIAGAVYLALTGYKKDRASLDAQMAHIAGKADRERQAGQQVFEEHSQELAFLPDEYWYPMATGYLVKALRTQRAGTLAQALDMYDNYLHRMKIEEANAQMVAQQQAQTAHLKSIRTSSKVSATANVANTVFNIASRL